MGTDRAGGEECLQGWYGRHGQRLNIHARPGVGDVIVTVGGKCIRAECKGGPLVKKRRSHEYPILRGALGQAVTVEQIEANDLLVVAVPRTPRFHRLADRWRQAPLVLRSGTQIVLVGRDGVVEGLELP